MRRGGSAPWWVITIGACILAGAFPVDAEETLLFYTEDGHVVITNTPSREDVRPVPGFEKPHGAAQPGVALPATEYDAFIEVVARENGLAPELVKAVALAESGFDPNAVSPKGAQGIMQLMPATARRYGVRNAFDPLENLRAGAMHLRDLLAEFGGDVKLALAAYNAGSGAVRRHGGVPAYRETQDYVRKIQNTLGQPTRRRTRAPVVDDVRVVREADGTITFDNIAPR